jgi:hypothetical protein
MAAAAQPVERTLRLTVDTDAPTWIQLTFYDATLQKIAKVVSDARFDQPGSSGFFPCPAATTIIGIDIKKFAPKQRDVEHAVVLSVDHLLHIELGASMCGANKYAMNMGPVILQARELVLYDKLLSPGKPEEELSEAQDFIFFEKMSDDSKKLNPRLILKGDDDRPWQDISRQREKRRKIDAMCKGTKASILKSIVE